MIVDKEVYLAYEAEDFLGHHGVKGQKWGIRNKITKGTRAVGRGARKTGNFVKKHPKGIAVGVGSAVLIAAGALATKHILAMDATRPIKTIGTIAKTEYAASPKKMAMAARGERFFQEQLHTKKN